MHNGDLKHNKRIMKIILSIMAIPLVMALLLSPPAESVDDIDIKPDSTLIEGYLFYRNHGIDFSYRSRIVLFNTLFPYMGTPHRSRAGRDGLDCSGLVRTVYNQAFELNLKGSSRDIFRMVQEIEVHELQEADLLFFKINSTQINHVGIYLGNNKFAHASSVNGVVINDLSERYYQQHFFKAGRLPV